MLLSALIALAPAARNVDARIVAVSMFKNGYAVVMRQIDVPGPGEYELASIPQASLGTLWFAASDGTSLDSVKTVNSSSSTEVNAGSLDQVLQANLGKEVKLGTKEGDEVTRGSVQGKLLAVGEIVVVQTTSGTLAIPKGVVSSVSSVSGSLSYTVSTPVWRRALSFEVGGKAGLISMVSLERGAIWSPGYSVDISDKQKLILMAKSTVMNDLEDMKNVDARFVTGFPNMEFANLMEPLTSGQSVDQFLGFVQSPAGFGGGGGGFGGQSRILSQNAAVAAPEGVSFMSANPSDNSLIVPMGPSGVPGQQLEDLFFYRQPNLTLARGDRAYLVLFRAEAPYKELYTWDMQDPILNNVEYRPINQPAPPDDVWHILQFKNTSGHPLTTAPATTFKGGQVLGQDTMNYVSAGGDAELRITKAIDIRAESSEEEVSRQRGAIKRPDNWPLFDLVTMKGTLQATNMKPEAVNIRIRHDFTGEIVSADGDPVVKKTARGLKDTNPTGRLTWTKSIEAGKKLSLTYTYQVYVRATGS